MNQYKKARQPDRPANGMVLNSNGDPVENDADGNHAFLEWFSRSMIVDDGGRPRVAYRAMEGNEVILNGDTRMAHAALVASVAERFSYGRELHSVYVRAINPFDFRVQDHVNALMDYMSAPANAATFWDQRSEQTGVKLQEDQRDTSEIMAQIQLGEYTAYETPVVVEWIKARGHDSIFMIEDLDGYLEPNIAVFSAGQIKSTANRGTWDIDDPAIISGRENSASSKRKLPRP